MRLHTPDYTTHFETTLPTKRRVDNTSAVHSLTPRIILVSNISPFGDLRKLSASIEESNQSAPCYLTDEALRMGENSMWLREILVIQSAGVDRRRSNIANLDFENETSPIPTNRTAISSLSAFSKNLTYLHVAKNSPLGLNCKCLTRAV